MSGRPILITGSQRSGSSWVAHVLAAHPSLALLDEPFNRKLRSPGMCAARFPHWYTYIGPHNGDRFQAAVERTLSFRYDLPAALRPVRRIRQLARVRRESRRFRARRGRRARPLVKQPTGLFMAEWLAHTFNARVIVLVRHPAAFVSSNVRLGWGHDFNDFLRQPALMDRYLAEHHAQVEAFAAQQQSLIAQNSLVWKLLYHSASQLRQRHPSWCFIRHEDLAADPERQFNALGDDLGLAITPAVQRAISDTSSADHPVEVPISGWKSLRRHSRQVAGLWRERLTADEVGRVRAIVGDVADHFYTDDEWH